VKTGVQVKEVLTDESLENLRDSCKKKHSAAYTFELDIFQFNFLQSFLETEFCTSSSC